MTRYCTRGCRYVARLGVLNTWYSMAATPGGYPWRHALYDLLRQRDGDDCQLCEGRMGVIRWNVKSGPRGYDLGPSIDHVTPKSLGGGDNIENLRLAHWGCNRNRGNRDYPPTGLVLSD